MTLDTTDMTHMSDDPEREMIDEPPTQADHLLEVRRRPVVAAALGTAASLVAVAYLARAVDGGGVLDWVVAAVLAMIGVANLAALVDARTPLLVADDLGIRLRLGRTWVGLPWGGLHEVEHRTRRGWWRDGLLTVRTHYVHRVLEDLDPGARRIARINRRLHRAPLAVPLGLGTRVVGGVPDLTTALLELADGRTPVVELVPSEEPTALPDEFEPVVEPAFDLEDAHVPDLAVAGEPDEISRPRRFRDPRPAIAHLIGEVAARFDRSAEGQDHGDEPRPDDPDVVEEPEIVASEAPPPARETVAAARAEVRHETRASFDPDEVLEEETQVWGELHADSEVHASLLIDDYAAHPASEPVIGPQFAAARERLGLSVDELADRTRIRPHVIEAIEVDDFSACGGDFYARGHLRTLARVLGVEGAPILVSYDERYADAPIDPRRVFEAELAGAGSIRATRGGPNWSVLVAAVMALILCWSVARLVTGGPDQGPDLAVLSGSGGPNHSQGPVAKPVPVTLSAAGGGAHVVVRDALGKVVFSGDLSYGQRHTVQASLPARVQSSDGSVVVAVNGKDRGRMGPSGRPATQSYVGGR
jgi:hypothetical protein